MEGQLGNASAQGLKASIAGDGRPRHREDGTFNACCRANAVPRPVASCPRGCPRHGASAISVRPSWSTGKCSSTNHPSLAGQLQSLYRATASLTETGKPCGSLRTIPHLDGSPAPAASRDRRGAPAGLRGGCRRGLCGPMRLLGHQTTSQPMSRRGSEPAGPIQAGVISDRHQKWKSLRPACSPWPGSQG